jgi:hypothetical protein
MRMYLATATALVVALGGIGSATGGTAGKATLRLLDKQPVTLRGVSFRARERVRVTITSDEFRRARTVRATLRGSFTAQFDVSLDRCMGLIATANGGNGSRAAYKLPQPQCPPLP